MTDGLRERKKADTRRALMEAAVRQCLERGYEAVTVADIANEVGVSRRTFSNYFDGVPACLAGFGITVLDDVLAVLAGQPRDTPPGELLRIGFGSFADRLADGFDGYVLLMGSRPELVGAEYACQSEVVDRVAVEINALLGLAPGDIRAAVLAGCLSQIAITVGRRWIADGRPAGAAGLKEQLMVAATVLDLTGLVATA